MADKENVKRPPGSKNNTIVGRNCIPLKPSNGLTNSTVVMGTHKPKDSNQTLQLLLTEDDPQSQYMTLSQAYHLKNNSKKKEITAEKPKQDANMPKKPVFGSYHGQIVQSKINSFRKSLQVKDESSAATKKLSTTVPDATKPQPVNTRVRHHSNTQDTVKQGISRTSAHVTIWKVPCEKELLESKTALSSVKTSSCQDIVRNKTLSRSIASEVVARLASSTNDKLMEKSKPIDQRGHPIGKATVDRSAHPKETAEKRKACLITKHEREGQNEKPVGSFWTTMPEDEQRLFTEKVNNTFSKCLYLINEGCQKEDILVTLNYLIKKLQMPKSSLSIVYVLHVWNQSQVLLKILLQSMRKPFWQGLSLLKRCYTQL
ncbi:Cytoskeleton-associated protein 2 [Plecturocebus cupreus]